MCLDNATDNIIGGDNNISGNLEGLYIVNNSNTNTITGNSIHDNADTGIYIYSSTGNYVTGNTAISSNGVIGILLRNAETNTIASNTIAGNGWAGIALDTNNDNTITANNIINNPLGIYLINSSADIHFNRIVGNYYGVYSEGNRTTDAINNWWGTNSTPANIVSGAIDYDPWLVLSIDSSAVTVTHSSTSDCDITADLTHNNQGEDTSSSGALPDGIPVNFTKTLGTINSQATTRSGKAVAILTSSTGSDATTITATLDNQTVSGVFRKSFSTIQAAVNDSHTSNGDVIQVEEGTYTENVVINKKVTIKPATSTCSVTVQAANTSNPVFTINSGEADLLSWF